MLTGNELLSAGEAVQNLAKQYASVIALGETLRKIGSLENLEAEVQRKIDEARATEARAISDAAAAQAVFTAQVEANNQALADAEATRERLLAVARADARQIVFEAEQRAEAIQAEAAAREQAFARDAERQAAELNSIQAAIASARQELASVQQAVDELKAKFL